MTLNEFFEELALLKHESWYLTDNIGESVRYDMVDLKNNDRKLCFCPITAVCFAKTGKYLSPGDFSKAAYELNLDHPHTTLLLVQAADEGDNRDEETTNIRKRMIQALEIEG